MSYPWVRDQVPAVQDRVVPATVERDIRGLAHEIRDEDIEKDKAGNRGLFLEQLRGILARCDDGDPEDPRWDELRLRALDRFAKLARVYEADAPVSKQGPGDPRILAGQAAKALDEMEESLRASRT